MEWMMMESPLRQACFFTNGNAIHFASAADQVKNAKLLTGSHKMLFLDLSIFSPMTKWSIL